MRCPQQPNLHTWPSYTYSSTIINSTKKKHAQDGRPQWLCNCQHQYCASSSVQMRNMSSNRLMWWSNYDPCERWMPHWWNGFSVRLELCSRKLADLVIVSSSSTHGLPLQAILHHFHKICKTKWHSIDQIITSINRQRYLQTNSSNSFQKVSSSFWSCL